MGLPVAHLLYHGVQRLLHVHPGFLTTQRAGLVDRRVLEFVTAQLHLHGVARGGDLNTPEARPIDGGSRRHMDAGAVRAQGIAARLGRQVAPQIGRPAFGGGEADFARGHADGGVLRHVDLAAQGQHL